MRVPNIVHGQSIQIANPNQKPEPRRRRENVSANFSRTVSGRIADMQVLLVVAGAPSDRNASRILPCPQSRPV
jgi:hypothetical protein